MCLGSFESYGAGEQHGIGATGKCPWGATRGLRNGKLGVKSGKLDLGYGLLTWVRQDKVRNANPLGLGQTSEVKVRIVQVNGTCRRSRCR